MIVHSFHFGRTVLLGGVFTGALVHPSFRGRGIFSSLIEKVVESSWELGCDFVLTMPNDMSFGAFMKNGWSNLGDRVLHVLPISGKQILKSYGTTHWLTVVGEIMMRKLGLIKRFSRPDVAVCTQREFPEYASLVASSIAYTSSAITLKRDAEWFRWRFPFGELNRYQRYLLKGEDATPVAYAVTTIDHRKNLKTGYLVDFAGITNNYEKSILINALEWLVENGVDIILSAVSNRSLSRSLRDVGFLRLPKCIAPKRFHTVFRIRTGSKSLARKLGSIKEWHLTLADWDNI